MTDNSDEEEIIVPEGQLNSDKGVVKKSNNVENKLFESTQACTTSRTNIILTSSQSLKETVRTKTTGSITTSYNTHSLDEELKKIRSQQSVLTAHLKCISGKNVDSKTLKNETNDGTKHQYSAEGFKPLQRQSFVKSESASLRDSVESDTSSSNSFDKGLKVLPRSGVLAGSSPLNRSGDSTDLETNASSYQDETVPIITQESVESLDTGKSKVIMQTKRGYSYQEEHSESRLQCVKSSNLSSSGEENRKKWLTADSASTNTNSRSMESLRHDHKGSLISSTEREMRRGTSSVEARSLESLEKEMRLMTRSRRTVSGGESIDENSEKAAAAERKRGLFASASKMPVPSHLSLMPPGAHDRRITILSPHSPMISHLSTPGSSYDGGLWQYTTQTIKTRRKKGNIVLPRLVLPGSSEFDPFAG